jgi:hypothetical protein
MMAFRRYIARLSLGLAVYFLIQFRKSQMSGNGFQQKPKPFPGSDQFFVEAEAHSLAIRWRGEVRQLLSVGCSRTPSMPQIRNWRTIG